MRVKINNETPFLYSQGQYIKPFHCDDEIILVVDQSKTNGAHGIATPKGRLLQIVQLSGNDKQFYKSPQEDQEYFNDIEEFWRSYLRGCKVIGVFPEEPVDASKKGNFATKRTLFPLCDVYKRIAQYFNSPLYIEVNNWAWKSNVLPKGYRGIYDAKGSYRYIGTQLQMPEWYNNDITDMMCILMYVASKFYTNYAEEIIPTQARASSCHIRIVPKEESIEGFREFRFNPDMTLEDNANYVALKCGAGTFVIPEEKLSPWEIINYGHNLNIDSELRAFIRR